MSPIHSNQGISTLVNHVGEGKNPLHAHVTPIFQTSTFSFPEVKDAAAAFAGEGSGYLYTRLNNPNQRQLALKIAALEGYDLMRAHPDQELESLVDGIVYATGMAAITSAILGRVKGGDTVIAQKTLYSATYKFFQDVAPTYGIQVVWMEDGDLNKWAEALRAHPEARLVYLESPANPTMSLVDIESITQMAHQQDAWVFVDNTFASPYCQRPLTLGADVVMHSTTKYIGGHGLVVGGAVVSRHADWARGPLRKITDIFGGTASPFDAWLTTVGLKTFELRMQRHCENAMQVARFLEDHPAVERVFYPGLESHPDHELARRQMLDFSGMLSFELRGGLEAGICMMNRVKVCTLAVSLGNVDTLIEHPASMTHAGVPKAARQEMGITDGLVRLSVGVENVEDLLQDLGQSLC